MDSHQLLFGVTAINVMLAATIWTGAGVAAGQRHPKVLRAESIEPTLWLETDRSSTSITLMAGGKRRVITP